VTSVPYPFLSQMAKVDLTISAPETAVDGTIRLETDEAEMCPATKATNDEPVLGLAHESIRIQIPIWLEGEHNLAVASEPAIKCPVWVVAGQGAVRISVSRPGGYQVADRHPDKIDDAIWLRPGFSYVCEDLAISVPEAPV
jgi:hypothetical protein